jgi:hypothetical protein
MNVVGVDPGGRYVGIVVLNGLGALISARVMDRHQWVPDRNDLARWGRVVVEMIDKLCEGECLVAVEGVKAPSFFAGQANGKARVTNPTGIIETASVFGAVTGVFADAVVVPPAKNGAALDRANPDEIRKGVRLGGPSDHARSAYDVARAAVKLNRLKEMAR